VGAEQVLVPEIGELPVAAIEERHRAHDGEPAHGVLRRSDDVRLERDAEVRVATIDVDQLLVVRGRGRHAPRRVLADTADLHDPGERAELEPAREHLAVLELVVAARVGAPDRDAEEGGALLADDRAPEAEVGAGASAAQLAAGYVAAPED